MDPNSRLLKIGKKLGIFKSIVLVTVIAVVFSACLNLLLSLLIWQKIPNVSSLFRSMIIPALISPLISYVFLKGALQLDEAEKMLRKSEEKYRNILESIEEGYYEVDLKGRFTFFNEAMRKMLGYSREEMIGMNFRNYMDKDNAEKVFSVFNQVFRSGRSTKAFDWQLFRKDDSCLEIEASVSLIMDRKGEPVGFRGIARDISERKQVEQEKARLEKRLHHALRMESIGTLAGGIAHDFNNLLMGIQGNVSLMSLSSAPENPNIKNLKSIEANVERGAKLTQQLLGFAREGKYQVVTIDPNELIRNSANMFGRTKKEISIYTDFFGDISGIAADRFQMEQVLLNLFVNAGQAMPDGGDLYLRTENIYLDRTTSQILGISEGEYVKFTFRDSGDGMDEYTRQRVFDPFFSTRGIGCGTGLGLASAYGIIKNHGGTIDVRSKKGKVSSFEIYLPAVKKAAHKKRPDSKTLGDEPSSNGAANVLLVDDEELVLDVGTSLLENMGHRVLKARNGKEALRIYKETIDRIDLVILDMIMPEMNGRETFINLKAIDPQVQVLLSSGYGINGQAQEIMALGCKGFIQKPFKINQLSQKIRQVLDT